MRKNGLGAVLLAWGIGLTACASDPLRHEQMLGTGDFTCETVKVHYTFQVGCKASGMAHTFAADWDANHAALQTLTSVQCTDSTSLAAPPPGTPFDMLLASGTGTLNGAPGAVIDFWLTDDGAAGTSDTISLTVYDAAGARALHCDTTTLDDGHNQAESL